MKIFDKVAAFGGGVVTTIIAFTSYVDLSAQPDARSVVDVCANPQGTLRLVDPGEACLPGERRIRLRQPELEDPKEEPKDNPPLLGLQQRVKDLEEKAAKGRLMASRVIAPFEVINDEGYVVFHVEDGLVRFNNSKGQTVGLVVMNEFGGYYEARSATAKLQTVLGASENQVNLFIQENDKPRINLGRNKEGQYGLRVYEPGGKIIAGIGQSTAGDGVVTVNDMQGNQRAAMYVQPKSGGVVEVLNLAGKGVASLLATEAGNGLMQLFNSKGVTMVEAGVNTNNIGVVRAGPAAFAPGVGILGLPGSYIAGKAAQ